MSRRILIVDGHPDPDRARFVHALADAYAEGARTAEHEVRRCDVAELEIPILRSRAEWLAETPVADVRMSQDAMRWCEQLTLLYPLWLGEMPALLKAWFEQVGRPGVVLEEGPTGPRPLMKGRSARIVVTMGMPGQIYSLWFGAPGLKALRRNILQFSGFGPVRENIIGMVEASATRRAAWLERMRAYGAKGV